MSPSPRSSSGVDMNEPATSRLARLLTMVPWLLNRQGIDIDEAAGTFGVSTDQLEADLQLLFLCGTPGGYHDDLIDATWEEGRVYLSNADTIARPLRLGVDEALTLMVGLRALAEIPGIDDGDAIVRALAKLEQATGTAAAEAAHVGVTMKVDERTAPEDQAGLLTDLRRALAEHRRVHLAYVVPSRDETTERDVDPMRVVALDSLWYLEAWCHRAQDVRLFRLDRITAHEVLDVDGTPPAEAQPRDLDSGVFQPAADDLRVTLDLAPQARWVADYYPLESREEAPDGHLTVVLATADPAWVVRLVLRLGSGARVVEPGFVARQVQAAARAALAGYEA